jgi:uncharacterized membrane protein
MFADLLSPIYFSPPTLVVSSLIALAGIVLIEGTVLRLLRWAGWNIAFTDAFIVNLISSLLGTGLVIFAIHEKLDNIVPPLLLPLGAILLSVVVEGLALKVLRRSHSFSRTLLSSLLANFCSYLFLFVMISLALVVPLSSYQGHPAPRPTPFLSPSPSASPSA